MRYDDVANLNRLGGYTLWHLTASRQLAPEWSLQMRLNNLTDKRYELARSYANEGRSIYVGLRWAPQR